MATQPLIDQFQDDLEIVIKKYMDTGLDLGSAMGTLEVCKLDLYENQKEDDEDDLLRLD